MAVTALLALYQQLQARLTTGSAALGMRERGDQCPRKLLLKLEMTGRGWEARTLLSVYQTGASEVGSAFKSGITGSPVYIPSTAPVCYEAQVPPWTVLCPSLCFGSSGNHATASVASWRVRLQSGFSEVLG